MRSLITGIGAITFIVCWFGAMYAWFMALRNRAPGQSFWHINGFDRKAFTETGRVYRRLFIVFWLVGVISITVALVLNHE